MSLNKNKIKTLKIILDGENFYPFLCAYSENKINIAINNLAKLINYILTFDGELPLDLKEILDNAKSYEKEGQYLIYSTNSYLDNRIKLFGLDPSIRVNRFNTQILELEQQISTFAKTKGVLMPLYGTIREAIEKGFAYPRAVYETILKQPKTDKKPITLGETETTYYSSILESRLQNVPYTYMQTGSIVAKQIMKKIIGKDITLYFLPTDKEIGKDSLLEKVSVFDLRSISIPSRYNLLSLCAKNKGLQEGSKISIDTGEVYKEKETPKPKKYSSFSYSTVEEITIDDNFIYSNSELTGDTSYDIDELYGKLGKKTDNESLMLQNLTQKMENIKNNFDIHLELRDGKYDIRNGRHRLIFLKHYYQDIFKEEHTEKEIEYITKFFKIPVVVNKTIEDSNIQQILIYIERINPNVSFYKVNIRNDKLNIVIISNGYAYHISSKEELIKYASYLGNRKYQNEFIIGENTLEEPVSYEVIFAKLILDLKGDYLRMDYLDLINYLQNNNIEIMGENIDFSKINYHELYRKYVMFTHIVQYERLRETPITIVSRAEKILQEYEENINNPEKREFKL